MLTRASSTKALTKTTSLSSNTGCSQVIVMPVHGETAAAPDCLHVSQHLRVCTKWFSSFSVQAADVQQAADVRRAADVQQAFAQAAAMCDV